MGGVLIFGNGFVAGKFKHALDNAIISTADITDRQAVTAEIQKIKPDVVINCAGKTGKPNVDWCEDHKAETFNSNTIGPLILAHACSQLNTYMVHIGSGCIYTGDNKGKGFTEEDAPNFFGSFYSRTKIWSEQALTAFPVLQLRLRMPVDNIPGPRNLITKIIRYPKIISIPNSVSILDDFINAAKKLIEKKRTGIYNVTNPGAITNAEILELYKEIVEPKHTYEIISIEELSKLTKAQRSNCVLNTRKLESEGIKLPPIKEAIKKTLLKYKEHK